MSSENPDPSPNPSREKLPPGQREVDELPAVSKGEVPEWPPDWTLKVYGSVEEEKSFDLSRLKAMPESSKRKLDFHCVEGWSKTDLEWTGIKVRDLLERVEVKEEAKYVIFHALDGYTTDLPIETCKGKDVSIVWELEGVEIPPRHGGKVRVVIESKYAYKGAKWLSGIELIEEHEKGYWEKKGYSDSADPWKEERYSD